MKTTLTFQEGTSNKFYELDLQANVLRIRFGKVGSKGQLQIKKFGSDADAKAEFDTLIAAKKKKGYQESESSDDASHAKKADAKADGKKAASKSDATADAKMNGKVAAKTAAKAKAPAKAAVLLPTAAIEDPPVPGLDLTFWRPGPVPVPEKDPSPLPEGDFVIEGYTISFGEGDEVIVQDAKGKKLKSVPPKVRKTEEYQSLMRGRKDERAREKGSRRILEDRMISGALLAAEEAAWLVEDDAFAPLLKGLIVRPSGRTQDAGLLVKWDSKRGLGVLPLDYDARWMPWDGLEIVHPMRLGADVTAWQDLLVDLGLQQGLVQAFREVKNVPAAQKNLTESGLLSGRDTRSGAAMERALMDEGWRTRRGNAKRKLSLREGDKITTVEAWFDYGEYYMPSDPTTTGVFGFFDDHGRPIKFSVVPDVLVSETIRSLELCCAQAGAKKDQEEEAAEGEEGDDAEASDDDDA